MQSNNQTIEQLAEETWKNHCSDIPFDGDVRAAMCEMYALASVPPPASASPATKIEAFKKQVIELLWNHYKENGGYTRLAASFIEKINGLQAASPTTEEEASRIADAFKLLEDWVKTYYPRIDVSVPKEIGLYTAYHTLKQALTSK